MKEVVAVDTSVIVLSRTNTSTTNSEQIRFQIELPLHKHTLSTA